MDVYVLAGYFRFFNLSAKHFNSFCGRPEKDVFDFIATTKKMTAAEFTKKQIQLLILFKSLDSSRILFPGHENYPVEFEFMEDPPVFLMFEGNIDILKKEKISVVGCRKPEERFLMWMDTELRSFLMSTGAVVVSGGAVGVDQKASRIALRNGGESIVVLPSGLDRAYPKGLKENLSKESVLYLSEYFSSEVMQKSHFVRRNRLISALGRFLFAVQFEVKSGTMITVNYGLAQNKEIGTIPDHPLAPLSSGNLKIIREGAHIVGSGRDLIDIWQSMRQLPLTIVPGPT